VLAVYPWDVTVGSTAPHDSAMNVIAGQIRSVAELGNRVRVAVGPVTAEITAESLGRLGLTTGQHAYASFKATGTRVVSVADPAASSVT
jgi:molybdopterin-binding protein